MEAGGYAFVDGSRNKLVGLSAFQGIYSNVNYRVCRSPPYLVKSSSFCSYNVGRYGSLRCFSQILLPFPGRVCPEQTSSGGQQRKLRNEVSHRMLAMS